MKNNSNVVVLSTLVLGHTVLPALVLEHIEKLCHLQRHRSIYKQLKFMLN